MKKDRNKENEQDDIKTDQATAMFLIIF